MSRALVLVPSRLPVPGRARAEAAEAKKPRRTGQDFDLVQHETVLTSRSQIERVLPDILGRALARIWIDPAFRDRFAADPKATLADYGVHLPEQIDIDFVTEGALRPQIVVHEYMQRGGLRRRLLYLQLVMMAGR
jgi:hypothetical protein